MHKSGKWKWSRSVVSDSLRPPWTAAYQAHPSMGFSRQEYWSGVPVPSPRVSLRRAVILFIWSPPAWPNHLSKASTPSIITEGIRVLTYEFGRTQMFITFTVSRKITNDMHLTGFQNCYEQWLLWALCPSPFVTDISTVVILCLSDHSMLRVCRYRFCSSLVFRSRRICT